MEKLLTLKVESELDLNTKSAVILDGYIEKVQRKFEEEESPLNLKNFNFSIGSIRSGEFQEKEKSYFIHHVSHLYVKAIKK